MNASQCYVIRTLPTLFIKNGQQNFGRNPIQPNNYFLNDSNYILFMPVLQNTAPKVWSIVK